MGYTSEITYRDHFVIKRVVRALEFDVVAREVQWLSLMSGEDRVPLLIEHSGNTIKMTHVGKPLSPSNAPSDLKEQMKDIAKLLDAFGCQHNDINPSNLMVRNGFVSIIDFQWATPQGEEVPSEWPDALNRAWRPSASEFDDSYSINRVLAEILNS